jgi:hypothetical protein
MRRLSRVRRALLFYAHKDDIVQTLLYVSDNVGSGDHVDQIQEEVDLLLGRLGVV